MLLEISAGAAGGIFASLVSRFDGGDRLKGAALGFDGIVVLRGSIAAFFCCGAKIGGVLSSKVCNPFALLSWAFEFVSSEPNSGEVSNEKIGAADKASGWSKTLFGFGETAASVEDDGISATAFVSSGVVVAGNVIEGWPKVVFFSVSEAEDESTMPMLFPSVLRSD